MKTDFEDEELNSLDTRPNSKIVRKDATRGEGTGRMILY